MLQITFRHISGSRATEVDVVPLGAHNELILGRAPSAAVRFDPWSDGMVGRLHARIAPTHDAPARLMLTDLGSRNGTFHNGRRIAAAVVLDSGDVVQLGEGGPVLEVLIDE